MGTQTVQPKFITTKFGTAIDEPVESVPLAFRPDSFYKGETLAEQNAG